MSSDSKAGVPGRRAFLKSVGAGGVGLVAANLSACDANSPDTQTAPATITPAIPDATARGLYEYDADNFLLVMNLGAFGTDERSFPAESRNIKVRALLHDSMYWKVTIGDETLLQQWTRISTVDTNNPASIEGVWRNHVGQFLNFAADGSVTYVYAEDTLAAYGYVGEEALLANIFRWSVAAGDPAADGFLIWTRAVAAGDVAVNWEVATDAVFSAIVSTGSTTARADIDHTVKVSLDGLNPGQTYYYRFYTDAFPDAAGFRQFSHTGRAKTLPIGSPDSLKFALLSCSSLPHGFFNAYRQVARRDDLDGCFHLGDYIYDYPGDPANEDMNNAMANPNDYQDTTVSANGRTYRHNNQTETITLEDYRLRFRNYREDIDLQLIHVRNSFINTWDDHETANDSYDPDGSGPEGGAENHGDNPNADEGVWEDRKAAAGQAYNEWLPIIDIRTKGEQSYNDPRLDRKFVYGDLAEMIVLDTRVAGRQDVANVQTDDYEDPTHVMMSDAQRNFMLNSLINSTAKWKLLGQQVMMGQLIGPPLVSMDVAFTDQRWNCVINHDQWDGYDTERETIFAAIEDNNIDNFICLTGDIHTSWAIDLVDDPRKRSVLDDDGLLPIDEPACVGPALNQAVAASSKNFGVEFVTPSITSPGIPDISDTLASTLTFNNPHIRDVDLVNRGYSIMEITPQKTTCSWYHVASIIEQEDETETLWRVYSTTDGANVLTDETPT